MRFLRAFSIGLIWGALVFCSVLLRDTRIVPHYGNVDPEVKPYVDQWLEMARERGIVFDKTVYVGFTEIKEPGVVGVSNYGMGFREIDISNEYWKYSTVIQRTILIWHELDHSYCLRIHDFGKNQPYDVDLIGLISGPGYYHDGCPVSIMYPYVLETNCWLYHYSNYINEMYDRCEPY